MQRTETSNLFLIEVRNSSLEPRRCQGACVVDDVRAAEYLLRNKREGRIIMPEKDDNDQSLRKHLLQVLRGGSAHLSFDDLVNSFPADLCNRQIEGLPYTAWQVLEHMRIAQWDILEFSRDADHIEPEFPKGYWPEPDELGTPALWQKTVDEFRKDLHEMEALVEDAATDLYARIPHGAGQTILREALLVADHNAYHLGVLAVMARIVKAGS